MQALTCWNQRHCSSQRLFQILHDLHVKHNVPKGWMYLRHDPRSLRIRNSVDEYERSTEYSDIMPEKQVLRRTINVIRYERLCYASTLVIWLSRRLFVSLIIVTRLSRASLLMSGDPAPHFNNTSWVDRKNIDDMLTNSIICWVCTSCCKSPHARIHLPYGLWCNKSSCSTQNPSPQMHKGFEEKRVGAKPVARSSCVACSRVFCTARNSHFYGLYMMWRLLCLVFAAHSPCQRFLTMCHRSASHRIDTLLLVSIKSSTVQSARHTARIDVLDALSICAPKEMNLRAEGLLVYSCRVRIIVLANTSTDASTTTVGGTIQRHPTTNIASVRSSSWHSVIIGILLHSMAVQGVVGVSAIWYLMVTACWTKGPIVNDRMSKSDAPVAMCLRWSQYVTWIF